MIVLNAALGLLPVLAFLAVLILLDSYKLVRFKYVIRALVVGTIVALISLIINYFLLELTGLSFKSFVRYPAPLVEESLKVIYVIYLIRTHKVGFIVDAAILGFAVGAGFAVIENIYYLKSLNDANIFLWTVRGFGTAAMHGGTTAIAAMTAKYFADSYTYKAWTFLPGLAVATVIHSAYNHFFLPPLIATAVLLIVQPLLIILFFSQSEKATEHWLGTGLDTDLQTFEAISRGKILETKVGKYLESLNDHFPYNVVADLFEYLKIHLELSMQAKGILLARKLGVVTQPEPNIRKKFDELITLDTRIGPTAKLAIHPFLRRSSRELWEVHMLSQ
ncbi:MAG: PrsW family glutamic-type intramembrane protease [Candidatus Zixiibacteriota bacterium]